MIYFIILRGVDDFFFTSAWILCFERSFTRYTQKLNEQSSIFYIEIMKVIEV